MVDYVLISPSLTSLVKEFSVGHRTDSDHLPLLLTLSLLNPVRLSPEHHLGDNVLSVRYKRLIWTDEVNEKVSSFLKSPPSEKLRNLITAPTESTLASIMTNYNSLVLTIQSVLSPKQSHTINNREGTLLNGLIRNAPIKKLTEKYTCNAV